MTIFGPAWEALELEHLEAFFEGADDEPLLWEAKGTHLNKKEVRLQVCGFANSHEGGYLILGADAVEGTWRLNGVSFPDEPATWISTVIGDLDVGVRPMPDFDVKAWEAPCGHVAVVPINPTSTPPCIANGTVYERIPGKTQTVRDPLRLAAHLVAGMKLGMMLRLGRIVLRRRSWRGGTLCSRRRNLTWFGLRSASLRQVTHQTSRAVCSARSSKSTSGHYSRRMSSIRRLPRWISHRRHSRAASRSLARWST